MDTRINIIKSIDKQGACTVKVVTIFVLAGLINPKFKYLHWKLIRRVGMDRYLDLWIYALNTAQVPEMAVVALCKKEILNYV